MIIIRIVGWLWSFMNKSRKSSSKDCELMIQINRDRKSLKIKLFIETAAIVQETLNSFVVRNFLRVFLQSHNGMFLYCFLAWKNRTKTDTHRFCPCPLVGLGKEGDFGVHEDALDVLLLLLAVLPVELEGLELGTDFFGFEELGGSGLSWGEEKVVDVFALGWLWVGVGFDYFRLPFADGVGCGFYLDWLDAGDLD